MQIQSHTNQDFIHTFPDTPDLYKSITLPIDDHRNQTYDFKTHLPPYRSLINPNKAYDYTSHTYFNPTKSKSLLLKYGSLLVANTKQRLIPNKKKQLSLGDLPDEILLLILRTLKANHPPDVVYCLYVCKHMHQLAKIVIYENPYITTTFRLSQFIQAIVMNKNLALLVRRIDLSKIQIGIELKGDEWERFASNIVFGSCGGQYDDELMFNGPRKILAGWRDFKYRFTPLWSDVMHRSSISTSFVPTHKLPSQFIDPVIYSPSDFRKIKGKIGDFRSNRRRSSSGFSMTSSSTSINSLFSLYNGTVSAQKSQSTNEEDELNDEEAVSAESVVLSNSQSYSAPIDYDFSLIPKPGFFNSVRTFIHATMFHHNRRVSPKSHKIPMRLNHKASTISKCSTTIKRKLGLKKQPARIELLEPFGSKHPQQSDSLKQYCFARDIPIGFILHILQECENLTSINLSGIAWTVDYQLEDYECFDWELSRGMTRRHASIAEQHDYKSMLLNTEKSDAKRKRKALLSTYNVHRPIFLSDTVREINFEDPMLQSLTISSIWPYIMRLKHLERLELRNCVWLDKSLIRLLILRGSSRNVLRTVDCKNSGPSTDSDWATIQSVDVWRKFFKEHV